MPSSDRRPRPVDDRPKAGRFCTASFATLGRSDSSSDPSESNAPGRPRRMRSGKKASAALGGGHACLMLDEPGPEVVVGVGVHVVILRRADVQYKRSFIDNTREVYWTMELTLQHLRLLREVARQSTITAAADSLGYTRSAVSQQLMGLERATGVAVLERVGRNVRLTDAGRVLVDHAEEVLVSVEAAQAALEAAAGDVRGVLDIGIYESIAVPFLAPLVAKMSVDHPDLLLRSREIEPEDALDAVSIGDLDLAFSLTYPHDPTQRSPDIERTPVVDERFVAVVPVAEAPSRPIELSELAGHPFVCPSPASGCGRAVVLACRDAGFEPAIAHQVDSYPTAIDLVGAIGGVALIPEFSVPRRSDIRACELRTSVSRTIEISHRRSSAERPAIRATLGALLEIRCDSAGSRAS